MSGQVLHGPRTPPPGEPGEAEQHRNPVQNRARPVTLTGQPGDILFDLRSDPAGPDPVDGIRLDEVLLQHGNFLSAQRLEEAASLLSKRYVASTSTGLAVAPATGTILSAPGT